MAGMTCSSKLRVLLAYLRHQPRQVLFQMAALRHEQRHQDGALCAARHSLRHGLLQCRRHEVLKCKLYLQLRPCCLQLLLDDVEGRRPIRVARAVRKQDNGLAARFHSFPFAVKLRKGEAYRNVGAAAMRPVRRAQAAGLTNAGPKIFYDGACRFNSSRNRP